MSLTADQIAIRKTGITASDIRALAGVDPYGRGPHAVWLDKMGLVGDQSNTKAVRAPTEAQSLGDELEPIVVRRLAEKVGLHPLRLEGRFDRTVRHPDHATHIATPDAWLAQSAMHDAEALGEAKVVGFWNRLGWGDPGSDEIPEWCVLQTTWQAYVTRLPLVHVGALIGTELRTFKIPVDVELVGECVEIADRFWTDHVLTKKPPPIDGSEDSEKVLRAIFPKSRALTKKADAKAEDWAFRYFAADKQRKLFEAEQEKARQALMLLTGTCERMTGDGWRLLWKSHDGWHVDAKSYDVAPGRRLDIRSIKQKER
jgi:predicted phage-related endonuclease